eukprot:5737353-Prymnesium_polylepis.1
MLSVSDVRYREAVRRDGERDGDQWGRVANYVSPISLKLPKCARPWQSHMEKRLFREQGLTPMAQRWPSASRPARDARTPCASARGAPAVSASE